MKKFAVLLSVMISLSVILLSCTAKKPALPSSSSSKALSSDSSSSSKTESSSSQVSSSNTTSSAHESSDPKVKEYYNAAIAYYVQKNYTNAVNYAEMALAIDPECYEALNVKGIAQYYSSGDPQDGLPYINKSLEINPDYQYAYFCKAMIYKGSKDWNTSISLFKKSIELKPDDPWSYYGISTIYADQDMVQESLEYLKLAIEKDPSVKETAKEQSHYDRMRNNPDFQALVNN